MKQKPAKGRSVGAGGHPKAKPGKSGAKMDMPGPGHKTVKKGPFK